MCCEITHKNIPKQLCPRKENGSVERVGCTDDIVSPKGNEECISGPVSSATSTDEDAIRRSFRIHSLQLRVPTRCGGERKCVCACVCILLTSVLVEASGSRCGGWDHERGKKNVLLLIRV